MTFNEKGVSVFGFNISIELVLRKSITLVLCLACVCSVGAIIIKSDAHAERKTTSQVEDSLENGVASAVGWDSNCRNVLNSNRGTRNPQLRSLINNSAGYVDATWLSSNLRGNASTPLSVDYGTKELKLRVNALRFMCGSLVEPDLGSGTSAGAIVDSGARWVTRVSDANDRKPNSIGATPMGPAMGFYYTRIKKLEILSSDYQGSLSTNLRDVSYLVNRDNNSRYWIAPPSYFSYNIANPGVVNSGNIKVRVTYKRFFGYHAGWSGNSTDRCLMSDGSQRNVPNRNVEVCPEHYTGLSISIKLKHNYKLEPKIRISPSSVIFAGEDKIAVQSDVENSGETASEADVSWQTTRFIVSPGSSLTKNSKKSDPCDNFQGYRSGTCVKQKDGKKTFSLGSTNVAEYDDEEEGFSYPIGTKICYVTSVNPAASSDRNWRHSEPACVTIAKTPWVQIWGGDVRVGSAIGTNSGVIGGNNSAKISTLSTTQENLYGSWGEYGMVAPTNGTISSASAGAFSGATGGSIGSNSALLSFANTASVPGRWANYTTAKIPNFGTATQTLPASTSSVDVGSYSAGTTNIVRVQGSNVLNLSGTLQAGTTLIVNTSRTVTITGNITYARQTIGSAREASQLVVAAQNINIAEAVTEVNGWLIATPTSSTAQGVVSTCGSPASPYYTGLRSTNCDKKLTINGAITARQLQLRRTAGANKDNLAAPAEVINQRADIFLWASSFATRGGLEMETASSMEISPRF